MFYTYILRSLFHPEQRYIGSTRDLKPRLAKHNAGEVPHTSKFESWKIETAVAFSSKEKAYAFEAYLQTHSGREFANRHFRYCIQKYFSEVVNSYINEIKIKWLPPTPEAPADEPAPGIALCFQLC
ncbi:MAG: GIY-YIG nuclease family protein [Lentisphaerae bacterium]|nr:GIY-YIG nuclease family protein [Lentisphaerota bacterium]